MGWPWPFDPRIGIDLLRPDKHLRYRIDSFSLMVRQLKNTNARAARSNATEPRVKFKRVPHIKKK